MDETQDLINSIYGVSPKPAPATSDIPFSAVVEGIFGTSPQTKQLMQRREELRNSSGSTIGQELERNAIPGISAVRRYVDERIYGDAARRFQEGSASSEDVNVIAERERQGQVEHDEGIGRSFARAATHIPALVGEFAAGGAVVRGIGGGFGLLSREAAPTILRSGLNQAAIGALSTPFLPSTYAEQIATNQNANPNESFVQQAAPALALAATQNAVLGQLQSAFSAAPITRLGRIGAKGVTGLVESAGADMATTELDRAAKRVTGYSLGLDTRHGTIGALLRGDDGAAKSAIVQGLTFAAFASLHSGHEAGERVAKTVQEAVESAKTPADIPTKLAEELPVGPKTATDTMSPRPAREDKSVSPEAADPLKDLSPEEVKQVAAALGLTQKALREQAGQKWVKEVVDAVRGRQAPESRPVAPAEVSVDAFRGVPERGSTVAADPTMSFWTETPENARIYAGEKGQILNQKLTFKNPFHAENWTDAKKKIGLPLATDMPTLLNAIRAAGHDGVIWKHHGKTEYVHFTPEKPVAATAEPPSQVSAEPEIAPISQSQEAASLGKPSLTPHIGGEPMIRYPILKNGNRVGEARVIERNDGKTLHVEWIGGEGRAAGEKGAFLGGETTAVMRQIVALHPKAEFLTGLPVGGRRPGERRPIPIPGRGSAPAERTNNTPPAPQPDLIGRLRQREAAKGAVPAKGGTLGAKRVVPEPINRSAQLLDILKKANEGVGKLALSDAQIRTLEHLIHSDSLEQVAKKEGVVKQAIAKRLQAIAAKLGLEHPELRAHIDSIISRYAVEEIAAGHQEEFGDVNPEAAHKAARHALVKEDSIRAQINELADQFLKESENGRGISSERAAEFARQGTALAEALDRAQHGQPAKNEADQGGPREVAAPPAQEAPRKPLKADNAEFDPHNLAYGDEWVGGEVSHPRAPTEAESRLPGGGEPTAGERGPAMPHETALANAQVDRDRARDGLPAIFSEARKANPQTWDEAMSILDHDPRAAARLVDSLVEAPRATTSIENALLLHERVALSNEHRRAMHEANRAGMAKDMAGFDRAAAKEADFLARIDRLDRVIRQTGTEWGRAGQFRRQLVREDYSLSSMLGRAKLAKGGKELTAEEKAEVVALQSKIEELEAKLAASEGPKPTEVADVRIAVRNAKAKFADMTQRLKIESLPIHRRILGGIGETFNAIRSLITSFDLSAVFRQGGFFTFGRPLTAAKAVPEMLRSFHSELGFDRAKDALDQRPNRELYDQAGLYLADRAGLSKQEEAFVGRWTKKIPLVAASERAYTAFLNRIRADVFDAMTGLTIGGRPSLAEAKAIAHFINVATGRGTLGAFEKAATPLANLFFSPRYAVSRFQLLAGQPFFGGNAKTRGFIAKEYARALGGLAAFYAIASVLNSDEKITFDPRSSDFGKVRFGKTRLDPLAGLSQTAVFVARIVAGDKVSADGKVIPLREHGGKKVPFGGDTVSDVIKNFIRGKLAPIPGAAVDVADRKNMIGEPTTAPGVVGRLAIPLAARDVYEAMVDQGMPRGLAISMLAILGMGTQTYEPRKK